MRIQKRALAFIAMAGIIVAACSSSGPSSLLKAGELSSCVDIEYSPMEFYADSDPNTPIGFDVESFQAVAKKMGLTPKVVSTGFDGLMPALTAGRCDIVWSALYINDTRLEFADAVPYYATSQEIMVPAGNPQNITAEADLCGKTVSFQSGGLVEERITAASTNCTGAGKAAIVAQGYKTVAEEYQQIIIGRADAVWEIDTSVADFMSKNPNTYEVAYVLAADNTFGVYYGKGKTDLGDALSAALKALKDDGTLGTIAAKYNLDATNLDVIK